MENHEDLELIGQSCNCKLLGLHEGREKLLESMPIITGKSSFGAYAEEFKNRYPKTRFVILDPKKNSSTGQW